MSIFSKLFGSGGEVFTPFVDEYFARRAQRTNALLKATPIRKIPGYDVVEEHEGGMGRVLIARSNGGLVAIKQLKPEKRDAQAADLLMEEAAKLIGLDGMCHLVPEDVRASVLLGDCTVVLPYCAGGSLDDRAAAGPLGGAELAYYGFVLAAELKELHSLGLLHLDLKPANVLLHKADEPNAFYRWRPLISDYGLSVYRQPGRPVPSLGGTPLFMSPEQLSGLPVEAPSDVWSFAATLYYLASKRSPLETLWPLPRGGAATKPVTPLRELRGDVPNWLSDLLSRCLIVAPSARLQNFEAVLAEFLRFMRIEDDKKTKFNGSAGPEKANASLVVRDSYALTLATKHGFSTNNGLIARIDLGWMSRLKEAEQLFGTYRAGPSQRGLRMIDQDLGSWASPESLLGRFAARPAQAQFDVPDVRGPNERGAHSINVAVPLSEIWGLLDLRCRLLVTIVEDLGRPADVSDLLDTATRWYATQSFPASASKGGRGLTREKCLGRVAQGFRNAGQFERALAVLEEARRGDPRDLMVMAMNGYCLRDLGRFDEALTLFKDGIMDCLKQGRDDMYFMVGFAMAEVRLRQGDLKVAELTYRKLQEQLTSHDLDLGLRVVQARRDKGVKDREETSRFAEARLVPGVDVGVAVRAAELLLWAGKTDRATTVADLALRDPRMRLATWGYFRKEAQTILDRCAA